MSDSEIFWLGGRPDRDKSTAQLADDDAFQNAMLRECREAGCEDPNFIAARGDYGTWLVEFARGDQRERILWNGKDKIMVLQRERTTGGWDEPRSCEAAAESTEAFGDAVRELLADPT